MVCHLVSWVHCPIIFIMTNFWHVVDFFFNFPKYSPFIFAHWNVYHVLGETCIHDNNKDFLPFCCCFKLISRINLVQWSNVFILFCFDQCHCFLRFLVQLFFFSCMHFNRCWIRTIELFFPFFVFFIEQPSSFTICTFACSF